MLTLNQIIEKHLQQSKYNQIEIKDNTFTFIIDEEIEEINILRDSFDIVFNGLKHKVKEYTISYHVLYNFKLTSFIIEEKK